MKNKYGQKIRYLRNKFNLSQNRFGKKIGVSGKTISSYETGRSKPPFHILEKIAETFNTTFISITDKDKDLISTKLHKLEEYLYDLKQEIEAALSL